MSRASHAEPVPEASSSGDGTTRELARTWSLTQDQLRIIVATDRSLKTAQAAAESAAISLSPPMARAVQATENAWRNIEVEFGMLTSREMAAELGSRAKNPSEFTAAQRKKGRLLGIARGNAILHPGFQLRNGTIREAIPALRALADDLDIPPAELVLWMCSPAGQLAGDRPVDRLSDTAAVCRAFANHFDAQW